MPIKLKPWWWKNDAGKLCITVRYGARVLEIIEGKNAIEAENIAEVISSLQVILSAVDTGELDSRIESLSEKPRSEISKPPDTEKKKTLKLPFRSS